MSVRPALPELRHDAGHARRVRGVPRGPGPLLLHEPHARPLAGRAHLPAMRRAVRRSRAPDLGTRPGYPPKNPLHRPLNLHARPHRSRRRPHRTRVRPRARPAKTPGAVANDCPRFSASTSRAPRHWPPWKDLLRAAVRARYLPATAAPEVARPRIGRGVGGCVMRVLLLAVFAFLALALIVFLFGWSLLQGF